MLISVRAKRANTEGSHHCEDLLIPVTSKKSPDIKIQDYFRNGCGGYFFTMVWLPLEGILYLKTVG